MRHGGLAQAKHRGEIAHAQLTMGKGVQHAHPCRVTQGAERVGKTLHRLRRHQRGADLADAREVDLDEVANFIFVHMSKCSYISRMPARVKWRVRLGTWGLGLGAWEWDLWPAALAAGSVRRTRAERRGPYLPEVRILSSLTGRSAR